MIIHYGARTRALKITSIWNGIFFLDRKCESFSNDRFTFNEVYVRMTIRLYLRWESRLRLIFKVGQSKFQKYIQRRHFNILFFFLLFVFLFIIIILIIACNYMFYIFILYFSFLSILYRNLYFKLFILKYSYINQASGYYFFLIISLNLLKLLIKYIQVKYINSDKDSMIKLCYAKKNYWNIIWNIIFIQWHVRGNQDN